MIDRTPCKALDEEDATGMLILPNVVTSYVEGKSELSGADSSFRFLEIEKSIVLGLGVNYLHSFDTGAVFNWVS